MRLDIGTTCRIVPRMPLNLRVNSSNDPRELPHGDTRVTELADCLFRAPQLRRATFDALMICGKEAHRRYQNDLRNATLIRQSVEFLNQDENGRRILDCLARIYRDREGKIDQLRGAVGELFWYRVMDAAAGSDAHLEARCGLLGRYLAPREFPSRGPGGIDVLGDSEHGTMLIEVKAAVDTHSYRKVPQLRSLIDDAAIIEWHLDDGRCTWHLATYALTKASIVALQHLRLGVPRAGDRVIGRERFAMAEELVMGHLEAESLA